MKNRELPEKTHNKTLHSRPSGRLDFGTTG